MKNDYPRVLIIGLDFNLSSGSGITMTNLFKDWPKDQLAAAIYAKDFSDSSFCDDYYILGNKERVTIFPFNLIAKVPESRIISKTNKKINVAANRNNISKKKIASDLKRYFFRLLSFLGVEPVYQRFKASNDFLLWLRKINPDIIFTHAGSLNIIRFVLELAENTNKKIAVHINDDYPITMNAPGILYYYWKRIINKEFQKLLDKSSVLLSICKTMGDEYKKRYNKDFIPFHNPLNINNWMKYSKTDWTYKLPFKILYSGRVGTGTSYSISDIVKAVDVLNSDGYDVQLEIQTNFVNHPIIKKIKKYHNVKIGPYISYSELSKKLSSVDLLVLPIDFDKGNLKYIRLSMPTKVSEYMASGTPVLVYSPKETALAQYSRQGGWAYLVEKRETAKVANAIKKLYEDISLREELGRRAKDLAVKDHDEVVVRERFRTVLNECL